MAVVKGAPETVFDMCVETSASLDQWREQVTAYASSGHKVIAAATKTLDHGAASNLEPDRGYTTERGSLRSRTQFATACKMR